MAANYNNNTTTGSSTGGVVDHVKTFLTGANKADSTEVCTETAPAVVQEHVSRNETVEQVEAIDRERHIHHHQHRVQPVVDNKVLPTEHKYQVAAELTRESKHDMLPEHREKLEQQRHLYTDSKVVDDVNRNMVAAPAVAAEHVHHHVHETIQPVINRETVQNTHVHTTIPIHEKIHDAPIVHEHTVLPTVSLKDFEAKVGGVHQHKDGDHEHAYYEGSPRVGADGKVSGATGLTGSHHHGDGHNHDGHHTSTGEKAGIAAAVKKAL